MKRRDVFDTIAVVLGMSTTVLLFLSFADFRFFGSLIVVFLTTLSMFAVCSAEHKRHKRGYIQRCIRERKFS